jgi:hypothetical protein
MVTKESQSLMQPNDDKYRLFLPRMIVSSALTGKGWL